MKMKMILSLAVLSALCAQSVVAQGLPTRNRLSARNSSSSAASSAVAKAGAVDAKAEDGKESDLNFADAPLEMVFKIYGQLVDRTVLRDPSVPANTTITIQSRPGQRLTKEEQIEAIEVVLEMNGVHMEPYGEKFTRALPREKARQEGIPLILDSDAELADSGRVVSMMFNFKNISTDEAKSMLEGLKSQKGILLVYERIGSILVTDTQLNINRMREIARAIDVATPVNENVFVRQIKNASAADIKTALEQIVQESQKELEKAGQSAKTAQDTSSRATRPLGGLLRRNNKEAEKDAAPKSVESLVTSVSDADRGMIRGKVLILADERSNKLIIVTAKTNMDFFDKVIEQLDIETTPDVQVKVYRLKYADAEDVSSMINELIGNASSAKSSSSSKQNQNQNAKSGANANMTRNTTQKSTSSAASKSGESKAGELSKDNVTVLADKRINGLVVMARKEDIPVLESIIEAMDVKLSQVLIEMVIIEVQLGDDVSTGIDWVHGMQAKGEQYRQALGGGGGNNNVASAASGVSNAVQKVLINGMGKALPALFSPGGAGLTYGVYSERLDLGAVIQASKSDSRTKYIASPVIMTVDNKKATIDATQNRQFLVNYQVSSSVNGTGYPAPEYKDKDIGITVEVTPKINPNGTVMLNVEEEYSQVGAKQTILNPQSDKVDIDTSLKRKMTADVLLENSQTVVLGGLTESSVSESESGIPILKDIPWIGKYLFGSTSYSEVRKELLIFMTPYVLDDGKAAQMEAARRKNAMSDVRPWEDHGWSKSELADPVSTKEQLKRQHREWKREDEEYESRKALDAEKEARVKQLVERAKKDAKEAEKKAVAEPTPAPVAPVETVTEPAKEEAPQGSLLNDLSEESVK